MNRGGNYWTLFTPKSGKFCTLFYISAMAKDSALKRGKAGNARQKPSTLNPHESRWIAMTHKYALGQPVIFLPATSMLQSAAIKGTIMRLLPKDGAHYQYDISCDIPGQLRRVQENELQANGKPSIANYGGA